MKTAAFSLLAPAGFTFVASLVIGYAPAAEAKAQKFVCDNAGGVPVTMAIMPNGERIPFIRWKSNVFDAAGWTPVRRCQEVSSRFDTYNLQGRLNFITTGRLNKLPVICAARSIEENWRCDGLLYTLKPGQDAADTLRKLLEVRIKVKGPLVESLPRYLSMDELLSSPATSAQEAGSTTVPPTNPSTTSITSP